MQEIHSRFKGVVKEVAFSSLRVVDERSEEISVRAGVVQPPKEMWSRGGMVTVVDKGGCGYAATADLSTAGLQQAFERARRWAHHSIGQLVGGVVSAASETPPGQYASPVQQPWRSLSLADKLDLLTELSAKLRVHSSIVDDFASLEHTAVTSALLFADGGHVTQRFSIVSPELRAVANAGTRTETRSTGLRGFTRQGGLEILDAIAFAERAQTLGEEAVALLSAPDCPSGKMSLVLDPEQMMLQIHESIGHPIELDRILGDERNYAGQSFVTPEMFGNYAYGSELLNITFDPSVPDEHASYAFDDEGTRAERTFLIKDGVLERPLGGATSARRAQMEAVACARASSWNRPPIDRMANLNLEPGTSSLQDIISSIEHGVLMKTNRSWSIDDSRNKFQFGCELGQIIEDGEIKGLVRNPNYRGISANFWRNLRHVGNRDTFQVLGTPYCGKGEPNQIIRVGHAAPICHFSDVTVFGPQQTPATEEAPLCSDSINDGSET